MILREHVDAASSSILERYCHVLPCQVERDCKVDASRFNVQEVKDDVLTADLRGRPLEGRQYEIPGYKGIIAVPSERIDEQNESSSDFTVIGRFEKLVVWGNAQPPSKSDPWGGKLLELVSATSGIHKQ